MFNEQLVANEPTDDAERTPCLFNWTEGGNEVYLIGSFINWDIDKKIKMKKLNGEFIVILLLKKDLYTYKFLVDGKQKCSVLATATMTETGEMYNIINMKKYIPFNFELRKGSFTLSYEKIWRHINLNNLDLTSAILPIPIYLENSRNIIHENMNGLCFVSEPLCNHVYFDTDTYKKHSIVEVCIVLLSHYKDNMGRRKKIFTKYNILTYMKFSKRNENATAEVKSEVKEEKLKVEEEISKIGPKEKHEINAEKELEASNPLKHFISF